MSRNALPRPKGAVLATLLGVAFLLLAVVLLARAASAGAAGCPNEALRLGPAAALPACRGYEMVSPVEKGGANITGNFGVRPSPDGDTVSYYSTASFAGSPASPLANAYIGRRGADWTTEAIDPPLENPGTILIATSPQSSPDQGITLQASTVALTPGAIARGSNIYLRDNATGQRTLIDATPGSGLFKLFQLGIGGIFAGASSDWSHLLFQSSVPMLPSPTLLPTIPHLYEFSGGELRSADQLPNGDIPEQGISFPSSTTIPYAHRISADGSRVFFDAFGPGGQLGTYMRQNGTTLAVSVPEGTEPEEAEAGSFQLASANGSVVYFLSPAELVSGVETGGSNALYRYETASRTLTDLTPTAEPGGAQVNRVLAAGEDGSSVYFSANAALTEAAEDAAAAPAAIPGETNYYAWHEGHLEWIARTSPEATPFPEPSEHIASPSGRFFAFSSYSQLTPADVPSPACGADPVLGTPESCRDVYAFDSVTEALVCITCVGPGRGDSAVGGQEHHETGIGDEFPRSVLDDGTVYVDTPNKLVPRDANGVGDVYGWRGGEPQLVSTGTGVAPSLFGNATLNGSDVFFLTNQQLVGEDVDDSVDLYDDREGGGLASQYLGTPPAACEAEGCKGAGPAPPDGLRPGSASAAPNACDGLGKAAKQARDQARRLSRQAAGAARGGGAAKARAKQLRKRAAAARRHAKKLQIQAKRCGGKKR